MSFGISVGDILAVGQIAWNVYKACKGAPAEFEDISREVSTFHTVIKELQDEVENEGSILNRAGNSKRKELEVLVGDCRAVLQQLERLVTRYWSLGTNRKQIWDMINFDTKEVQDIRQKLTSHTSRIQIFLDILGIGSLGRMEKKLETVGRIEKKLETVGRIEKKLETVGRMEKKLETVGRMEKKLETVGRIEKKLETVGRMEKKLETVGRIEKQLETVGRMEKKLETFMKEIRSSKSDLKVKTSSSDSKASTTSAHTATASGNKTTRTPTIDTPKQETSKFGRSDARKLNPPKAEASSSSPHRTESPAQQDNKGFKTKDQSSRTEDPLSGQSKSKDSSLSPHRTEIPAQKDNKGSKAKGRSSLTVDPLNGRSRFKTSSSSPHRIESSAQKDNKGSKAKVQSSLTVDPSSAPSESKIRSSSPNKTASSAQKDNKASKAKDQSSMIGKPSTESRSPPREAKIVKRQLHLTLEELFTGTRKKVKIPREHFDKSGKRVISDKSVELDIKPGLRTGFEFKQEGVGEEGPQDIFFIVTEKPHPTFTRDKNNINSVVELDLEEAFTGSSRTVFTIDGKYVPVSGAGPTPPGHQMTFPGLGMPKSGSPGERGDFIVTIKVKFPSSLSKDERKSIKQALQASAFRSDK